MRNAILKLIVALSLSLFSLHGFTQEAEVKVLSISNPQHSSGIQIGDVLTRTIEVEVNSVHQLPKTALPLKGETRNGIELRDIEVQTTKSNNATVFKITLAYQVFTSAAKPVVMQLPAEHLVLTGGAKRLSIDIPAWKFWFSPLVAEGISNAKQNLQPQAKPALLDLAGHQSRFWIALVMLSTSLFGLMYVNADQRWLPFMNGAFAQAYRQIKKLGNTDTNDANALIYMHQAFNKLYGANLFANEIDLFLAAHPKFLKMKSDIAQFFEQSNASLFAQKSAKNIQNLQHLKTLSKRLRDCERGIS